MCCCCCCAGTDLLWAGLVPVALAGDKVASMAFSSMACAVGACTARTHSRREYSDFAMELSVGSRR